MPLFTHRLAGYCPLCNFYFRIAHVYIHLERDVFIVIYEHEDGRMCGSTSIDAAEERVANPGQSSEQAYAEAEGHPADAVE